MNADEIKEEIEHQRILQKEYRKRLRVLEQQAAKFGIYVPPHLEIEIDDIKEKIRDCEKQIDSLDRLKFISSHPDTIVQVDQSRSSIDSISLNSREREI